MEEVYEKMLIKELSVKYNKKEKVLKIMMDKLRKMGYDINQFSEIANEFYSNKIT